MKCVVLFENIERGRQLAKLGTITIGEISPVRESCTRVTWSFFLPQGKKQSATADTAELAREQITVLAHNWVKAARLTADVEPTAKILDDVNSKSG